MNLPAVLLRRFSWLNFPTAALIALLQRTPVLNLIMAGDDIAAPSPIAAVLKSSAAVAASLGAMNALAGATTLVESNSANSPLSVPVNTAIQPVIFGVTNTINIGSWNVTGSLPPGLALVAAEDGSMLTGPGTLDSTQSMSSMGDGYGDGSSNYSSTTPILMGTPTKSGTFTFTLQAFEFGGEQGLASSVFSYTVVVGGGGGSSSSGGVGGAGSTAPSFATQPKSLTVNVGQPAVFSAFVSSGSPAYQWQKSGANIPGANGATYTIANPQSSDAGIYAVVATTTGGSTTSSNATLTVIAAPALPSFTAQPVSQSVVSGGTVTFTSTASGNPEPTYQWFQNSAPISGATDSTLLIGSAGNSSAGTYFCVASNASGSAQSNAVTLSVTNASAPSVAPVGSGSSTALTTRGSVPANGNFSASFTVSGTTAETVLIRAVGPGLTSTFGTGGVVPNPVLQIQQTAPGSATVLATNSGWASDQSISAATSTVGAFPLQANSPDAAVLRSLQPGTYSVQVSDLNGNSGTVLVQVIQVP